MTINLSVNLSITAVVSIFWPLYKQAIHVSTSAPETRWARYQYSYPLVTFLSKALHKSSEILQHKDVTHYQALLAY